MVRKGLFRNSAGVFLAFPPRVWNMEQESTVVGKSGRQAYGGHNSWNYTSISSPSPERHHFGNSEIQTHNLYVSEFLVRISETSPANPPSTLSGCPIELTSESCPKLFIQSHVRISPYFRKNDGLRISSNFRHVRHTRDAFLKISFFCRKVMLWRAIARSVSARLAGMAKCRRVHTNRPRSQRFGLGVPTCCLCVFGGTVLRSETLA